MSGAPSGLDGPARRERGTAAVTPQLRQPGSVLGPRAARTITAILDATRQIFLTRGYAGTIDEIAKAAGMLM